LQLNNDYVIDVEINEKESNIFRKLIDEKSIENFDLFKGLISGTTPTNVDAELNQNCFEGNLMNTILFNTTDLETEIEKEQIASPAYLSDPTSNLNDEDIEVLNQIMEELVELNNDKEKNDFSDSFGNYLLADFEDFESNILIQKGDPMMSIDHFS